ncbi:MULTISPECIES: hypothetical protein [Pseudomonas syringae group]|uniref:hypothetical protein n=1 Tax=Pseudomonas syringae group TaxID=136849 RepID=UPI000F3BA4CE|nr:MULTISPECIES: hypothetical protein [Pseudomonas syringae group]RMV01177.1 hypothetical protein ALP20_200166 [Pseudomonas coronafaciens pv. coronafaciens]
MHKITMVSWRPGCMFHLAGALSYHSFTVVLYVNVVTWKILTYTLLFGKDVFGFSKPALIDNRHPNRFWLWQAGRLDFAQHQASSIISREVVGLSYDSFGPFRVVRKLPPAELYLLTNNLFKGFYDINANHIGHLCSPIRIPYALLLERIELCIEYANEITAGSSLPPRAGGGFQL